MWSFDGALDYNKGRNFHAIPLENRAGFTAQGPILKKCLHSYSCRALRSQQKNDKVVTHWFIPIQESFCGEVDSTFS